MNTPEFESALARLRERVAELPEPQRAELERLVGETIERHRRIVRTSREAHRSIERLELGFDRLREACDRLAGLAEQARATLERVRDRGARPAPGLN